MASQDSNTIVQWPLVGGIDERTRAEVVEPTSSFVLLENVRQAQRGGYTKRKGFAQAGTTNTATAWHLTARKDTPLAIGGSDASKLYQFCPSEDAWSLAGKLDAAGVSRSTLFATEGCIGADVAHITYSGDDYFVVVAISGSDLGISYAYAACYDAATLTCLSPPTKLGTHTSGTAQVLFQGNTAICVTAANSGNNLYVHVLDIASLAGGSTAWVETTVATDRLLSAGVDCTPIDSGAWALAYVNTTAFTPNVTVKRINVATTLQTATIATAGGALTVATRCLAADTLWVATDDATTVRLTGYNPADLTSVTATTTALVSIGGAISKMAITMGATAGTATVSMDSALASIVSQPFQKSAGAVAVVGFPFTIHNCGLLSKPTNVTDEAYGRMLVWLTPRNTTSAPLFDRVGVLVDLLDSTAGAAGYITPRAVAVPRQLQAQINSLPTLASYNGSLVTAFPVSKNARCYSADLISADLSKSRPRSSAEVAGCTVFGGGLVTEFDGVEIHEANFVTRPPKPTYTLATAGSLTTAAGGYRYIAVYSHVDSSGQIHRSAPSDPTAATGNFAAKAPQVSIRTLAMTSRRSNVVQVELYRTIDGGSTYYLMAIVNNDPTAGSVLYSDNLSDATVQAQAQLYRQPGAANAIQPHACPPAMRYLVQHQDRLVGVADDGISVWYSAKHVLGEGIWFADLFQFPIEKGGPIAGLASQDGRLYVFKRGTVFVVDGDGPAENGAAGDFGQPYELPSDVGCIDHRSIVTTTAGVFFQSLRGIELLSRGGGIAWIGEPIASTLTAYPVVTSAAVLPVERLVMFTCVASENEDGPSGAGVTLVFDYAAGLWVSVDRITHPTAGTANAAATHAAMLPLSGVPAYHWADSSGRVYKHQTSSLDGSNWVTAALETGWVKLSGFMGEQHVDRAQLLADFTSNHNVTFSIAYEYRSTYASTRTYTANVVSSQAALGRERLEVVAGNNTRGSAVKIRLSDATPTDPANFSVGTGKGATWIALAIEGSPRRGAARLPSGAR